MRRLRKSPLDSEVRAESDDEHSLALLRNAVISGVHETVDEVIVQAAGAPRRVVLLETPEVVHPTFVPLLSDFRVAKLVLDVGEIIREYLSREALYVLDEHRSRAE